MVKEKEKDVCVVLKKREVAEYTVYSIRTFVLLLEVVVQMQKFV